MLVLESLLDGELAEVWLVVCTGSLWLWWLDDSSVLTGHVLLPSLHQLLLSLFLAQRNSVLMSLFAKITVLIILETHLLFAVIFLIRTFFAFLGGDILPNREPTGLLV